MTGELEAEAAKAVGKIAVDTVGDLRGALKQLLGPTLVECAQVWGYHARLFRIKNLISVNEKIERLAIQAGYSSETLKILPPGDSIRAIEAITLEDEEEIQELWARLLLNACLPDGSGHVKKVLIGLLREISPIEANIMGLLWEVGQEIRPKNIEEIKSLEARSRKRVEDKWELYSKEEQEIAVQNLLRLRCVAQRPQNFNMNNLFVQLPREISEDRRWAAVDYKKFETLVAAIQYSLNSAVGSVERRNKKVGMVGMPYYVDDLGLVLTHLGIDLMKACHLPN